MVYLGSVYFGLVGKEKKKQGGLNSGFIHARQKKRIAHALDFHFFFPIRLEKRERKGEGGRSGERERERERRAIVVEASCHGGEEASV